MSTANNKEPKYRPALSLPQVRYLQSLLENAPAHEATAQLNESIQLSFKLLTFRVSIGATTPAYKAAGKESIEDKLGLGATKEEQLVSAYQKFEQYPELCSIKELALVQEYLYINDLMTPEEEAAYEQN